MGPLGLADDAAQQHCGQNGLGDGTSRKLPFAARKVRTYKVRTYWTTDHFAGGGAEGLLGPISRESGLQRSR